MDSDLDAISIAKLVAWEEAKGKLRLLYSLDGKRTGGSQVRPFRFELVEAAVERFIKEFELDSLHD